MISRTNRTDTILALLPPAVAVAWVIADAATGLVAADRATQTTPPVIHIVSELEAATFTTSMVEVQQKKPSVIRCSHLNDVEADGALLQQAPLPQASLIRLCRAGLKFTSRLPKS